MAKKRKIKRKVGRGNFRQPTAAAAASLLKSWAKKGVTHADQIAIGVGGLKDQQAVNLAKIRFREAAAIRRGFDARVKEYEVKLEKHKQNMKEWKACKKIGVQDCGAKPKHPAKPSEKSKAKDKRRAGNFRPMTKKQAAAYLKQFFHKFRIDIKSWIPDSASGAFAASAHLAGDAAIGSRGHPGNFVPRVQEAIEILGVAEAAKIANHAKGLAVKNALKKVEKIDTKLAKSGKRLGTTEAKYAKKVAQARARLEKLKIKLDKERNALSAYLVAAARHAKRSMRRR